MSYTTTWSPRGVIWNYSGVLTGDELLRSNQEIYGDPRFDDLHYQIVDLTAVRKMEVNDHQMRKIAHLDMAAALTNPRIRVAVVTDAPEGLGITNTYHTNTANRSPWKLGVFSTREQAEAWVET